MTGMEIAIEVQTSMTGLMPAIKVAYLDDRCQTGHQVTTLDDRFDIGVVFHLRSKCQEALPKYSIYIYIV
jgi:hypothetical protein